VESIECNKEIKAKKREWGNMMVVKLRSEKERRRMLENKKFKGKVVWLEENLTWKKRKMRWKANIGSFKKYPRFF